MIKIANLQKCAGILLRISKVTSKTSIFSDPLLEIFQDVYYNVWMNYVIIIPHWRHDANVRNYDDRIVF